MIIRKNDTERLKHRQALNLQDEDIYVYKEHFIESLRTHKNLIPNSTATTIEEALAERIAYEEEQRLERIRLSQEEQAKLDIEQ